ncbi:MAG: hypothetical protein ACR2NF_03940 [Pirellulales bacterium]
MASEPDVPACIKKSPLLWVKAGGTRSSPEDLVLELMRSTFWAVTSKDESTRRFSPDSEDLNQHEQVAVRAFRGRQKKEASRNSIVEHFFAPVYPQLARTSWLRPKDARVVVQFLFEAVFIDYLNTINADSERKSEADKFIELMVCSLLGDTIKDTKKRELFADTIGETEKDYRRQGVDELSKIISCGEQQKLRLIGEVKPGSNRYVGNEFSEAAFGDWKSLLEEEPNLSRNHWLDLVACYLRMVVPMSVLVQTQGVILFDRWLRGALKGENLPSQKEIESSFQKRGRGILRPSHGLCRDHLDKIAEYIQARIRVNGLLADLQKHSILTPDHLKLPLVARQHSRPNKDQSILELLKIIFKKKDLYKKTVQADMQIGSVSDYVERRAVRLCSEYSSWRKPLDAGPGKLLKYLMYPMYCIGQFDERGSHLMIQPSQRLMFRIEPAPLVLQFITLMKVRKMQGANIRRAPVLRDIEEHFQAYGIDYAASPSGREILVSHMRNIGLLAGSADAGESARINLPYKKD